MLPKSSLSNGFGTLGASAWEEIRPYQQVLVVCIRHSKGETVRLSTAHIPTFFYGKATSIQLVLIENRSQKNMEIIQQNNRLMGVSFPFLSLVLCADWPSCHNSRLSSPTIDFTSPANYKASSVDWVMPIVRDRLMQPRSEPWIGTIEWNLCH